MSWCLWGWDSRTAYCVGLAIASLCGSHNVAGFESRLVLLSKALYHTCFICGQRCKLWSRRPKLTSLVISDVKPITYSFKKNTNHTKRPNFRLTFNTKISRKPGFYLHALSGVSIERSSATKLILMFMYLQFDKGPSDIDNWHLFGVW